MNDVDGKLLGIDHVMTSIGIVSGEDILNMVHKVIPLNYHIDFIGVRSISTDPILHPVTNPADQFNIKKDTEIFGIFHNRTPKSTGGKQAKKRIRKAR